MQAFEPVDNETLRRAADSMSIIFRHVGSYNWLAIDATVQASSWDPRVHRLHRALHELDATICSLANEDSP